MNAFNKVSRWNNRLVSLNDFRHEIERLSIIDRLDESRMTHGGEAISPTQATWHPACEIEEALNHYLIRMEIPGVPKEALKLELEKDCLFVTGERNQEERGTEEGRNYFRRRYGKFKRVFSLPPEVDFERLAANYQDGILKVYVPKAEEAKPRQIKINSAK